MARHCFTATFLSGALQSHFSYPNFANPIAYRFEVAHRLSAARNAQRFLIKRRNAVLTSYFIISELATIIHHSNYLLDLSYYISVVLMVVDYPL